MKKLTLRLMDSVLLGTSLFSILGCASISVQPQHEDATRRLRRKPQVLIVKDFGFASQAAVRADRNGKELVAFEQKLQISLREQLVRALGRYVIPVTVAVTSQELQKLRKRQPAWLITGQFTRVNQGSRAMRIAVGLGAGGTKMETNAEVIFQLAKKPGRPNVPANYKSNTIVLHSASTGRPKSPHRLMQKGVA
jgi:hypothetical protein